MPSHSNEKGKTQKLIERLVLLADIHSRGEVHGKLSPSSLNRYSTGITVQEKKPNLGEPKEFSNGCRPAEEKDSGPSQAGDIFSLGCYFYEVITSGEHPFGKPADRTVFIANNLYDLAGCEDDQLRKLIARMVCHDSKKRPTSSDLLDHPCLWKEDRIERYLTTLVESIDENNSEKWDRIVLISPDQQSFEIDIPHRTSVVKSVTEILTDIKEKKETALNACQMFPDLLCSIYFTENPGAVADEVNYSRPDTFGNVLIANACFGEVQPVIRIKRRHGRFGLQPVHVMQFPCFTADSVSLLKRLSCLSHQNLLRYFYLAENSIKNLVLACEPFAETLDTWMEKKGQLIKLETAKEILTQITTGLIYYHYNNIVHGNLTCSQIAIIDGGTITAKIAKFLTDDEESTDGPAPTKQNDVRKLGRIYKDLLQRVKGVTLCSTHLLQSMTDPNDECIPPSDAIFYHPFFWSPDEMADFLLVSSDFYKDNPTIDRKSSLFIPITTPVIPEFEYQQLKTNRSAIEYFSSSVRNGSTADDQVTTLAAQLNEHYPMLVTQTWLRLQTFKSTDEVFDLGSFYHPIYDFPTYSELMYHEEQTSEVTEKSFHSPEDEPEGTAGTEIALLDRSYSEEFVVEKFQVPQSEKEHPIPQLIQNYLEKYLLKWKIAEKTNAMAKKMKHPVIDPFGRTAMHLACYSDDFYEPATKLIDLGFNPNTFDNNGVGPLHIAALNNCIKIGKLLIDNHAIIDKCDLIELRTPLFLAAIGNAIAMLDLLIKGRADINKMDAFGLRPLHIAVANNAYKVVEHLLKHRADVNAMNGDDNTPLHTAVIMNRIDMAQLLLKYKADPNIVTPGNRFGCVLHMAVANCSTEMLHLLLKSGANPNLANFQGETPLHLAAFLKDPSETRQTIVDLLMTFKANRNAVDGMGRSVLHVATLNQAEDVVERLLKSPHIEIDPKEKERKLTPLHLVAWYGSENIARMLIEKGANTDARDYIGETPLEYAASSNAVEVAKQLLKAGAKAKSRRWKLRSPLHIAAAHGAQQVAELLIDAGADVNAFDEYGFTPLHYAEYRKHVKFVEYLQSLTSSDTDGPRLSKPLSPADMSLIPELTNSFKRNSIQIPSIQIQLPKFLGPNFKLTVSQQIHMYTSNGLKGSAINL